MVARAVAVGGLCLVLVQAGLSGVGGAAALAAPIHPRLDLTAPGPLEAIVQFHQAIEARDRLGVDLLGLERLDELRLVPALLVRGDADALRRLAEDPRVALLEPNPTVEFDLDTATVASRAKAVWDDATAQNLGLPPLRDDDGNLIDGRNVTVAVVDSGVNAYHPDLPYRLKVLANLFPVSTSPGQYPPEDPYAADVLTFLDLPATSLRAAHGHHVAGIVAGTGLLSQGAFTGAAPGASLVAFGDQLGGLWFFARAWEWIYEHGHEFDPPVRIVTNSWGYGFGDCEPDITLSKVQEKLIGEKGLVMVFSAGNLGGNGNTDNVRTQPHCGPEGAIGVANFDDRGVGTRDGLLSPLSSRGRRTDPMTWPDLSAPGESIMSTGPMSFPVPTPYFLSSGTSMAAPHVAGAAALLLQAHPGLTPAQVECLLEQTAYKFDPDGTDGPYATGFNDTRHDGSNHARGHGLLDAYAAVAAALDLRHGNLVGAAATCDEAEP